MPYLPIHGKFIAKIVNKMNFNIYVMPKKICDMIFFSLCPISSKILFFYSYSTYWNTEGCCYHLLKLLKLRWNEDIEKSTIRIELDFEQKVQKIKWINCNKSFSVQVDKNNEIVKIIKIKFIWCIESIDFQFNFQSFISILVLISSCNLFVSKTLNT